MTTAKLNGKLTPRRKLTGSTDLLRTLTRVGMVVVCDKEKSSAANNLHSMALRMNIRVSLRTLPKGQMQITRTE